MYTAKTLAQVINLVVSLIEIFLGLRFIFRLFGANPAAPFVAWLYEMTAPLLEPFQGAFPSPVIEEGFVFEFTTLIAMLVYSLLGWFLLQLLVSMAPEKTSQTPESRS